MSANDISSGDTNYRKFILVITTFSAFIGAFIMSCINIALPAISRDFSVNAVLLGWLVTANILATAILMIPFGRLADTYDRTKIYLFGSILQALTSFMAAFSPGVEWLLVARVLQGVSAAMTIVSYPAILISVYPANERGRVLGINVAGVYIGISLSPFLGGILTQTFGWQSIFIFTGALVAILSVLLIWKLKREKTAIKKQPFDFAGAVIFGLALFTFIFGLSDVTAPAGTWMLVAGIAGICLFVFWETKTRNPLLNIALFRHNGVFAFSNLAALINYSATYGVAFLLSLYLQYIKGFEPAVAGLLLVTQPAVQAVMSPIAGRLSDKFEPRVIASAGMALTAAGLAILIFLRDSTSLVQIITSLVVLGFGFGLFSSPNTNAILSSVDKKSYSIANAVTGTSRTIGQMLSLATITLLFTLYIGPQEITTEYYPQFLQSTNVAFIIFTVICLGGIFASLARGKTHGGK